MRTRALVPKFLVLIASLMMVSLLGSPGTASATGTSISPSPSLIWVMQGSMYDSGVTLAANVDTTQTSIVVHDNYVLLEGMLIKIDSEYMLIDQVVDGGLPGHNDTLVVTRAQHSSVATSHSSGAAIKTQAITVQVSASNFTDPTGLGGFGIYVGLPSGVELVRIVPQTAWLSSTGRFADCDSEPGYVLDKWWVLNCRTWGNTPLGATGSGLIATLTLLPLQDVLGVHTVDLSATLLTNISGQVVPATTHNLAIRMMKCPDANLDNWVDSGDMGQVARNLGDIGVDSGATLADTINSSQTNIPVSDRTKFTVGDTISIDREQMTVSALHAGSPDNIDVVRAVNSSGGASHNAETHIFIATVDGNHDGKKGYTDVRDVTDDGFIDSGDTGTIARTMVTTCPAP